MDLLIGGIKLKIHSIVIIGLLVGFLLVGCGTMDSFKQEMESGVGFSEKVKREEEVNAKTEKEVDPKTWKDLSTSGDLEKLDFEPNARKWIASRIEVFSQEPDQKLYDAGFSKEYDYYLKAQSVLNLLGTYIKVEGIDLEKDFENLKVLAKIIVQEYPNRPEKVGRSFDYMKQLVNDIDIAINKGGNGETFGVSYQLEGDKIDELESFIKSFKDEEQSEESEFNNRKNSNSKPL